MVTKLKDVAQAAGVAINSASSILNGRKDSWASEATKARVFAAAERLCYTPDRIARSLSKGKTQIVGLIVPNLSDPFFTALATAVGNELIARDYDLVIEDTRLDYQREILCLNKINHWRFDGLVIAPIRLDILKSHLVPLAKRGTPVSVLGNHHETRPLGRVGVDLDQAIDEAFARLVALGHRRIGLLLHGWARQRSKISRIAKFEQALKKHGFGSDCPCVAQCEPALESAHAAFRDLLERTAPQDLPTAFICMNDLLALGAMRAAREAGLSVPQDLSFIGVGDVPVGRFLPVSLSSIAEPLEEMARAAVAQILDESPVQDVELSATFVERESIGPAKDLITSACASRRESCVSPRRGGG